MPKVKCKYKSAYESTEILDYILDIILFRFSRRLLDIECVNKIKNIFLPPDNDGVIQHMNFN